LVYDQLLIVHISINSKSFGILSLLNLRH